MNNNQIQQYLNEYLTSEFRQFAVLLFGEWGSGKTFFIKNQIKQWKDESEEYKPLYVSLNGLAELPELKTKLSQEIKPLLSRTQLKKTLNVFSFLGKALLKVDLVELAEIIGANHIFFDNYSKNAKDHKILVLDDLERTNIDIQVLFGFIQELIENYRFRVILIANENKLDSKYLEIKEKLVGQSLKMSLDADEIAREFATPVGVKNHKDLYQKILSEFIKDTDFKNIRLIKRAVSEYTRFTLDIKEKFKADSEFTKHLFSNFLVGYLVYHSGIGKEEEKFGMSLIEEFFNRSEIPLSDIFKKRDETEEKQEESIRDRYSLFLDKHTDYNFLEVLSSVSMYNFISSGLVDYDLINSGLAQTYFKPVEEQPTWKKLNHNWIRMKDEDFLSCTIKLKDELMFNSLDLNDLFESVTTMTRLNGEGLLDWEWKDVREQVSKNLETHLSDPDVDIKIVRKAFSLKDVLLSESQMVGIEFIEKRIVEFSEDHLSKRLKDVLETVDTDIVRFEENLSENDIVYNKPLFSYDFVSYIDVNKHIDSLISLPNDSLGDFLYLLYGRSRLSINLSPESLKELESILAKKLSLFGDKPIKRLYIQKFQGYIHGKLNEIKTQLPNE